MSNLFSTGLLALNSSSTPEFAVAEISFHPGRRLVSERNGNILLAGGFTSVSPDNGFYLSPTLQLNLDLTDISIEDLETIAYAELDRFNAVNYRSYEIEANTRVCAIGTDSKQLERFTDIYGGVLDIVPLLVQGYSPEISTAVDLCIDDGKGEEYRLNYKVQSPIDLEICTYCGECGPACPEHCLSENLYIDFARCNYCKKCEQVCAVQAIDLHSVVEQTLNVPAVIVLGRLELNMPETAPRMYSEKDLPELMSNLHPCRIDEVVSWDGTICQYSHRSGGEGCRICLANCRYNAITADKDGIHVDAMKCEECGACVSSCPTGALQNERFNDETFFNYIRRIHVPVDGTVVLGSEKALHRLWWQQQKEASYTGVLFLQYENVQSLSLYHFLSLLDRGAGRVAVLVDADPSSEWTALDRQIELTNRLIAGVFEVDDAVCRSSVALLADDMHRTRKKSFGCNGDTTFPFVHRRQALGRSLEALISRSGQECSLKVAGTPYLFASVICDTDKCTHCLACLNDCRVGALTANEESYSLYHLGMMCVRCGLCVGVCPENALALSAEVTLAGSFFMPVKLTEAEPMQCRKCGKVFGTKKSFERVMAILRAREAVETSHFEYCETCRVINLFETD